MFEISRPYSCIEVQSEDDGPYTFRWYGGTGVGIFDPHGVEVDYFNMSEASSDAFESAVRCIVTEWGEDN